MHTATAANQASGLPFEEADEMMKDIKDELVSREALTADHEDIERLIAERTTALARALMQAHLDLRAAKEGMVEVEGADGIARTQVRESTSKLETIFGEVTVTRRLYQAPGAEGLAPLDAALNLPAELYSHGVRRFVAEECARASFDEVVEALERRTGAHVPKRQVEELSVRAAQDFDAFYAERTRAAEDTSDPKIRGHRDAVRGPAPRDAQVAETTPRRLHTRFTSGNMRKYRIPITYTRMNFGFWWHRVRAGTRVSTHVSIRRKKQGNRQPGL